MRSNLDVKVSLAESRHDFRIYQEFSKVDPAG
jgi:hypothetical protein